MQTQKDRVQAYKFSTGRLVSAVATGDPGNGQSPFRRAGLGLAVGTLISVLLCAGAVVWGLLHPTVSSTWREQGAIVVDKSTGSRYVYLDGELRPAANYASALLASDGRSASVQFLDSTSMANVTTGPEIGILNAPDTLPATSRLLVGRWELCLDPADPGATVVDLDPAAHPAAVTAGERILVTEPGRGQYIVWDGTKYPLPDAGALAVLGLGDAQAVTASATWLAALPTGPALAPAAVPDKGRRGAPVAGHKTTIGELFTTTAGGATQYYQLRSDGLAPVSGTELALITATPGQRAPVRVTPQQIAAVPVSADRSLVSGLPALTAGPAYSAADPALCVAQASGQQATGGTLGTLGNASISGASVRGGVGVIMPTGEGMIAAPPGAGVFGQTQAYLITDTGEKYAMTGDNTMSALGYGAANPQTMPASVLDLIPSGPSLSVTAAREAVQWPTS
jgi:type VII secretion protein EccB